MANPTALYSYQGQAPAPLPKKILLSDGRKRTDVTSFTEEELTDAGFTGPYEVPNYDQEYQRLLWNSETLSFVVEDISDEELWSRIRKHRDQLLLESDWAMLSDSPNETNFHEWEMYRQKLRDISKNFDSPKEVIMPMSPENLSADDFDQPEMIEDKPIWRMRDIEAEIRSINQILSVGISTSSEV